MLTLANGAVKLGSHLPSNALKSDLMGIVHAHKARAAGHEAAENANDILVLGLRTFHPLLVHNSEDRFDFVRHNDGEFLTPSDGSFLVVAKVKGKDLRGTQRVGALNTSELQAHYSAHANEPRRLSYGWNTRKCSYLEELAPLDEDEVHLSFSKCIVSVFVSFSPFFLAVFTGYLVQSIRHFTLLVWSRKKQAGLRRVWACV